MAELKRVIGQNHITNHFRNAIKMDKISHAYIINGEADSGKRIWLIVLQWLCSVRVVMGSLARIAGLADRFHLTIIRTSNGLLMKNGNRWTSTRTN